VARVRRWPRRTTARHQDGGTAVQVKPWGAAVGGERLGQLPLAQAGQQRRGQAWWRSCKNVWQSCGLRGTHTGAKGWRVGVGVGVGVGWHVGTALGQAASPVGAASAVACATAQSKTAGPVPGAA